MHQLTRTTNKHMKWHETQKQKKSNRCFYCCSVCSPSKMVSIPMENFSIMHAMNKYAVRFCWFSFSLAQFTLFKENRNDVESICAMVGTATNKLHWSKYDWWWMINKTTTKMEKFYTRKLCSAFDAFVFVFSFIANKWNGGFRLIKYFFIFFMINYSNGLVTDGANNNLQCQRKSILAGEPIVSFYDCVQS